MRNKLIVVFILYIFYMLTSPIVAQINNCIDVCTPDNPVSGRYFTLDMRELSLQEKFLINVKSDSEFPWGLKIYKFTPEGKLIEVKSDWTFGSVISFHPGEWKEINVCDITGNLTGLGHYYLLLSTDEGAGITLSKGALQISIGNLGLPAKWYVSIKKCSYAFAENKSTPLTIPIQLNQLPISPIVLNETPKSDKTSYIEPYPASDEPSYIEPYPTPITTRVVFGSVRYLGGNVVRSGVDVMLLERYNGMPFKIAYAKTSRATGTFRIEYTSDKLMNPDMPDLFIQVLSNGKPYTDPVIIEGALSEGPIDLIYTP